MFDLGTLITTIINAVVLLSIATEITKYFATYCCFGDSTSRLYPKL